MIFKLQNIRTGEIAEFPFCKILEFLGDQVNDCIRIDGESYKMSTCTDSGAGAVAGAEPKTQSRGMYQTSEDTVYYAPLSGEAFEKNGNVDYIDTSFGKMIQTDANVNSYVKLPVKYSSYELKFISFVIKYTAKSTQQGFFMDAPHNKADVYSGVFINTNPDNNTFQLDMLGSNRQVYFPLNTLTDGNIYLITFSINGQSPTANQQSAYVNGHKVNLTNNSYYGSSMSNITTPKFGSSHSNSSYSVQFPSYSPLCELLVEKRAWSDEQVLQYAKTLGF